MAALEAEHIINLVIGLLALVPAIILLRKYKLTSMVDFLLFSVVFLSTSIASISNVLAVSSNSLIFYQLNVGAINLTFLCLLIHGLRIRWDRTPRVHQILGGVWFGLLTLIILFWTIEPQPDSATVLGIDMPYSITNHHPDGAGFHFSDTSILYSSSFYLIGQLFWTYATIVCLYSYYTIKPVSNSQNVVKAYRYWIFTWSILLVWNLMLLPWVVKIELVNLLLLLLYFFIIYLSLKMPESLLISHVQVLRAVNLTDKIRSIPEDLDPEFGMESLVTHVKTLSTDMFSTDVPVKD